MAGLENGVCAARVQIGLGGGFPGCYFGADDDGEGGEEGLFCYEELQLVREGAEGECGWVCGEGGAGGGREGGFA